MILYSETLILTCDNLCKFRPDRNTTVSEEKELVCLYRIQFTYLECSSFYLNLQISSIYYSLFPIRVLEGSALSTFIPTRHFDSVVDHSISIRDHSTFIYLYLSFYVICTVSTVTFVH